MIVAKALCVAFAQQNVVNDVSFSIDSSSVVGFLGPNGAGKSTTMRMLVGYLAPRSGSVHICGVDMARHRRRAQSCIGYLPEAASGYGQLTVQEFLTFCGGARGLHGRQLQQLQDRVCEQVALTPALYTRLSELSKGWRQRAWFAQALLHDPPVLILDEPTDGLDPNQKRQVRDLIREIAPRKTILLSTHILEEAEELCDHTIIMNAGRLVVDRPTHELIDGAGRLATSFYQYTASPSVEPVE